MAESPKKEDAIIVDCSESLPKYNVTGVRGKSITYLIAFLLRQSVPLPRKYRVEVFTMNVEEKVSGTIVNRHSGMLLDSAPDGTPRIFQGELIEVTGEYIVSESDRMVKLVSIT